MGARQEARATLAAAGLRPQKRWGQHFLCDGGVARRIVDTAEVGPNSVVLEIGPGLGALSDLLAERAGRLYLIEIDRGLGAHLENRYASNPHVRVLIGDVLGLPVADLVAEPAVTVVANLPYNVAVPVLFRLLELRARFARAIVMLQREVAARLAAPAGHDARGAVSVLLQTFSEVRVAFGVSRRSFFPRPHVDSTVVDIRWSASPRVQIGAPEAHRAVVRAAFGQRRKMLRNALAGLAGERGIDPAGLEAAFAEAGVDSRARAETLDLAAFGRLAQALER